MIYFLSLLLLLSSAFAYENGFEYCQKNATGEIGTFHKISQELSIYSYLKKPFDPTKPTILFFSGGPGASIRGNEFGIDGYNVIFFEERGMGCSKPSNEKLFLDPDFYGSLHTVADARKVVSDYGLQRVILYGHSYGTVVASLFASQFPAIAKKVILEGAIAKGGIGIWRSERRRANLQKTFDQLPEDLKSKVIFYSHNKNIHPDWFSVIGTMMSYLDNGYSIYRNFLENVLLMEEENFISFVGSFYPAVNFTRDGEVVFGMITCKELGGLESTSNLYLTFDQSNELSWQENAIAETHCKPLGIKTSANIDLTQYPVTVPVIYLAGEGDGATDLDEALFHFKNVAKGRKNLYVLKNGGHLPNLGALKDDRPCSDEEDCKRLMPVKAKVKFFESILSQDRPEIPAPWFEFSKFNYPSWPMAEMARESK